MKRHDAYVVAGPAEIGNGFGYYGTEVPEGGFVVVADGEYVNGGFGPSTIDGTLYRTRERAEAAAKRANENGF